MNESRSADEKTASPTGMAPNFVAPEPSPVPQTPYRVPPVEQLTPVPIPARRVPYRAVLVAFVALLATVSVVLFVAFKPKPPPKARSIGARLDLAAGEVTVQEASSTSKAISGTPLASGATVHASKGARALVRTGEGAGIFLRGDTKVVLLERGVSLESGEIWLDAPRVEGEALAVKTGKYGVSASDAGVSIRRDGDAITVYVARGLAILTSPGGRVEIGAGEQGKASGDAKPEVSAVAFWNDWTGGMGDQRGSRLTGSGTGRLYGLDPNAPAGAPAKKLGIAKQVVKAVIREGIAETEVDQTFANPGGQPIEGWYWFTIPQTATVSSFALETNGVLVEGEVIERREAAAQYGNAVRSGNEPALLEWVDGRTYRARIYPVPASGTRRVVLRYVEMLPRVEGKTRYVYPLRSDDPVRFDELSLSVDVGQPNQEYELASSLDARVEAGGRVVSMRRSGYVPRADFQLEMVEKKAKKPEAHASAWRYQAGADQADYVMLRYVPERDFAKEPPVNADVVLVVDTSAGGDESARQLRVAAAEATLRALSDHDHFAVVALDVAPRVVYPKDGLAPATEGDIAKALEKLADHAIGGATDLGAMFEPALARLHGKEQAALVYVGDGAATSGETGNEALVERLRRSLTGSRARFFAIGTGSDARHELLAELARAGGGQTMRIDEASQTTGHALRLASVIKTATITDLALDLGAGLDQPLSSVTGKLSRGEELVLLARTHHPLPDKVGVHYRFACKDYDEKLKLDVATGTMTASLVPRLWAAESVRRLLGTGATLEDNRGQILQLGTEYGLVTPFTSSLALDSEGAYARQGIPRKASRVRGVRLTSIGSEADEIRIQRGLLPVTPPMTMGCDAKMKPSSGSASTEDQSALAPPPPPTAQGNQAAQPSDIAKVDAVTAKAAEEPPAPSLGGVNGLRGQAAAGAEARDIDRKPRPVATVAAPQSAPPAPKNRAFRGAAADDERLKEANEKDGKKALAAAAITTIPVAPLVRTLSRCSDVASRPLAERLVIWQKRAKKGASGQELGALYDQAYSACELPDWRDEAALLDIVQRRIETEQTADVVLRHFASHTDAQRYLAKNLLRRTVDLRVAAVVSRVLYGGVDWSKVDRELVDLDKTPEKQLLRVKQAMLVAPGDPQGEVRLVRLLARNNDRQEALAHGRRLRDRGFLTPSLARELGDVLADAGEHDEAMRTYSEIVEFDGTNAASRRLLGDIFQRQGWHAASYRQYKTLTDLDGKNPLAWLRLANAAAGAGRVDEALRIEREVAGGEGSPGPNDPRAFARLLSASRLGLLLEKPDAATGVTPEAIGRKLKELSLFSGPGSLSMLVWDDLDAQLVIGALDEKRETFVGEATDASAVGLYAVLGNADAFERTPRAARYRGELLARKVPYRLVTLGWDGRAFKVTVKRGTMEPNTKASPL